MIARRDRVIVGGQDKYQENEEVSPEVDSTQASETYQETGGMIDLKGQERIAGEADPDVADQPQPRHARVEGPHSKSAGPAQRNSNQNPGGAR